MNRLSYAFQLIRSHIFAISAIGVFILLRIPSLIEPYWYGDEGIYAVIGHSLRNGSLLYRDIWDNKPPLLYLIYALGEGKLFWAKLLSLLAGIGSIWIFYLLAIKIIKKKIPVIVAIFVFAILFGLPLLEGNIANAENFMLLPIALGAYYLFFKSSPKHFFIAGLFLSFALMTKVVAVFDILAFLFILFLQSQLQSKDFFTGFKEFITEKKLYIFFGGVLSLPFITGVMYGIKGSINSLLSSTFTNNVSYVGYENYFLFPLGLVFLKVILLGISLISIYGVKERLPKQYLFILPWMAFSVFSMFFSDRPYTHYVLMGLIPFCLLIGAIANKVKLASVLLVMSIIFAVYLHFPIYKKTGKYYTNYYEYVIGSTSFREYVRFFDSNAVRDYDVALYIKMKLLPGEKVYYWSDSAQLYVLSDVSPITKYIVAYHAIMYEDAMTTTLSQIQSVKPRFIVSSKDRPIPQAFIQGYTIKYSIDKTKIYEKNN